jgi:hypothetical protein
VLIFRRGVPTQQRGHPTPRPTSHRLTPREVPPASASRSKGERGTRRLRRSLERDLRLGHKLVNVVIVTVIHTVDVA